MIVDQTLTVIKIIKRPFREGNIFVEWFRAFISRLLRGIITKKEKRKRKKSSAGPSIKKS